MPAVSGARRREASDWIFGLRSTEAQWSAKTTAATTNAAHSAAAAIAIRLRILRRRRRRIRQLDVRRDPECRDRGREMRQVHGDVHEHAHRAEMREEEHDDVESVPDAERPEVQARRLC